MHPTKKFDCEAKRVEHALRHLRVLDAMEGSGRISGALGWCMADYNTHRDFGSGDRICYHGVLDMFRIPKDAAAAYASQQDEKPVMAVASSMERGERDGGDIERVYIFTNCDSVKLHKNGECIGTYYPDRKTFPNLPHPPVVISDFIGDTLEKNEKLSRRDADAIKELFAAVVKYGDKSLPLKYKLKMVLEMLRLKMPYDKAVDLFMRYIANWGCASLEYEFVGYIGDQVVARSTKGPAESCGLLVEPDTLTLSEGDTYDVARVVLKHVDQHGNTLTYSSEIVHLEVQGAGEIIGPKQLPLMGGSAAFWVKTTGEADPLTVKVHSNRFGTRELTFRVEKTTCL
jgi:beta-galactosidase